MNDPFNLNSDLEAKALLLHDFTGVQTVWSGNHGPVNLGSIRIEAVKASRGPWMGKITFDLALLRRVCSSATLSKNTCVFCVFQILNCQLNLNRDRIKFNSTSNKDDVNHSVLQLCVMCLYITLLQVLSQYLIPSLILGQTFEAPHSITGSVKVSQLCCLAMNEMSCVSGRKQSDNSRQTKSMYLGPHQTL